MTPVKYVHIHKRHVMKGIGIEIYKIIYEQQWQRNKLNKIKGVEGAF